MFPFTETVRAVNGEAHEDDIGVRIGQWTQSVIVFLSCCIPESQLHLPNYSHQQNETKCHIKHFSVLMWTQWDFYIIRSRLLNCTVKYR